MTIWIAITVVFSLIAIYQSWSKGWYIDACAEAHRLIVDMKAAIDQSGELVDLQLADLKEANDAICTVSEAVTRKDWARCTDRLRKHSEYMTGRVERLKEIA